MESNQTDESSTDKKIYLVSIFLILLVVAGVYFVYKIPDQSNSQIQQSQLDSEFDSISTGSSDLGGEAKAGSDSAKETIMNNDKLVAEDLKIGTGAMASSGKQVTVNYVGTLTSGQKFDSSYDRNEPFTFNLGAGEVIRGWDQGVDGMKVGGKRKLTIPPSLGYGSQDLGVIPPNSTLIFEVELLEVR